MAYAIGSLGVPVPANNPPFLLSASMHMAPPVACACAVVAGAYLFIILLTVAPSFCLDAVVSISVGDHDALIFRTDAKFPIAG